MHRRQFLFSSLAAAGAAAGLRAAAAALKFGHRQANMVNDPGPAVFDLAKQIQGLSGVELQVYFKGTTLCDQATLAAYQRAAERTGLSIPSVAGVWPPGATLLQPAAEENLRNAIRAAESLHATTILAACFEQNCPNMDQEQSYGPVVALLQKVSGAARDAGVTIGMETSNAPAGDRKLIDLVDRPSVKVYYDLDNVERYAHTGEAVPGIAILKSRIRQVHLKNEDRLLEQPGRVNWADAVKGLAAIGYAGWLVFETTHSDPQQCIEATRKNIAFVTSHYAS
ncbi:MAG: TIM barrel protein [Bryobacteraceae bacterium]|jgi:sugar phosphate isomerase/epimerase